MISTREETTIGITSATFLQNGTSVSLLPNAGEDDEPLDINMNSNQRTHKDNAQSILFRIIHKNTLMFSKRTIRLFI